METQREDLPYMSWSIAAGALGGATVAVFFFLVDMLAGRPFATPSALGSTLFLGQPFDLTRDVDAALVAGYTALHFGIFLGLASVIGSICFGRATRPSSRFGMATMLTLVLFAATSLLSLGFHALSGVSLWTELGVTLVLAANLLAAIAMAILLTHAVHTRWVPPMPLEPESEEATRQRRSERPPIDSRQLQAPPAGRGNP